MMPKLILNYTCLHEHTHISTSSPVNVNDERILFQTCVQCTFQLTSLIPCTVIILLLLLKFSSS